MADETAKKSNGEPSQKVVFDFIKSNYFRVIHVDGAIGSLVPTGHIQMAIFSERVAIPQRMAFKIGEGGQLGENIASDTVKREGLVREVEADLILNLRAAKALRDWLSQRVNELELALSKKSDASTGTIQ